MVPFRKYAAFFQPSELEALRAAYDEAWEQLAARSMNAAEESDLKNRLAQVILASACTGNRDAKRLKEIALRAVSKHLSNKQSEFERC